MEVTAEKIRLQIDGLELHFDQSYGLSGQTGWSVARDFAYVVSFVPWADAWAALTDAERAQIAVFTNQMR